MKPLLPVFALCVAFPLAADPRPASELETQIVLEAQSAFLTAREAGDAAARWALLGPALQARVSQDDMAAMIADERRQHGALLDFNPSIVTAYPEQNAIVIDYVATYANDTYECGFVVWTEVDAGIRLTRIERTYVPFDLRETTGDAELFEVTQCRVLPAPRGG